MLHLPPEIIISILSNLDLQSLLVCQRTCRKFKEIYDGSSRLQYIAELGIAGMIDNPYCPLTVAERLERLRKREDAWASLQSDFTATIAIPKSASSVYDVTPNVYLLGIATSPDLPLTRGIQSLRLPSDLDDTETPFMDLRMVKHVVDFGTSIEEHDLLAVVTMSRSADPNYAYLLEVALLRHSTASVHDEAEQQVVPIWSINEMTHSVSIEISGENLAITVMSPNDVDAPATLHIFDWKTGRRKGQRRIINNLGLVFLREDLLLIPNTQDPSFGIYHIPYITEGVEDERLELQPLLNLALPTLTPSHNVTGIQCRCDPSPTSGGVYPKYAPKKRPYANDPMQAIMITEMRIRDMTQGTASSYVMFVHRKNLLAQLPEGWEASLRVYQPEPSGAQAGAISIKATQPGGDEEIEQDGLSESDWSASLWEDEPSAINSDVAPTKAWDEWGPDISRWIDSEDFSSVYITSTAGQRFVSIGKQARREPKPIRIIDFNQYNVRKALTGDLYPSVVKFVGVHREGYEDEEDPWGQKEPFVDPSVQSNLPYIEMITPDTYDFNAVLMDEQRILGIRTSVGDDWNPTKEVELLHYG